MLHESRLPRIPTAIILVVASFYVSADNTDSACTCVSADGVSAYWREHCAALEILAVDDTDFTEGHTVSAALAWILPGRGRCRSASLQAMPGARPACGCTDTPDWVGCW